MFQTVIVAQLVELQIVVLAVAGSNPVDHPTLISLSHSVSAAPTPMTPLEERLGYEFRDPLLLAEAMTHSSFGYEARAPRLEHERPRFDNQRLEFLGDAVLQLVLTDEIYRLFPDSPEGQLTKLRVRLVSRRALRGYAKRLELGSFLLLGRGEEASGGRTRASSLADAFEALMGAIYLDRGLEPVRAVLLRHCRPELDGILSEPAELNPKGELQELLQSAGCPGPTYEVVGQTGPHHARQFTAIARWHDREIGRGTGSSKKQAEVEAAADALARRPWEGTPAAGPDQAGGESVP